MTGSPLAAAASRGPAAQAAPKSRRASERLPALVPCVAATSFTPSTPAMQHLCFY
jgi:hypothetical protein